MPDVAPPAYCAEPPSSLGASLVDEADDDDDEEDGDDDEDPSPVTITLHANTNVQGTGNLIASPALADATRFSALLLAAVQSLNAKAEAAALANGGGPRPILNVQIVLDCGITIHGDGNVVGHRAAPAQPAVAGPKRKAEEVCISHRVWPCSDCTFY